MYTAFDPADYVPCEEDAIRTWLGWSGYTFNGEDYGSPTWERRVSSTRHTARRDHKDGRVKKGDLYRVTKTRIIDDETGEGWLCVRKKIIRRAAA
jgi:hypothetical protein